MTKLYECEIKVLKEFEARTDEWTHGDFNNRLKEVKGSRYKTASEAIALIEFVKLKGLYPNVVEKYQANLAKTNAFNNKNEPPI